jgi:RNase P protein component
MREAVRAVVPRLVASDIVIVARPPAVTSGADALEAAIVEAAARAGLLRTDI